ncbi:hypothetical protein ACRALDRAFT_206111 [Sodiomyces alcalophilus JCM 7366]|uniref:uncharacterized protein n=1 Tax=Sodiomyces alcalophilus JCM 7366 TaxID=591952 RepID=UPI0039B56D02
MSLRVSLLNLNQTALRSSGVGSWAGCDVKLEPACNEGRNKTKREAASKSKLDASPQSQRSKSRCQLFDPSFEGVWAPRRVRW